jgi:large subunit ribosomal protein L20
LNAASGFRAASGTLYRPAIEFVRKANVYAYRDRRQRKRHFRTLWITRLGGALRSRGIYYNRFSPALVAAGIELNRKMLSELAIVDPAAFDAIVEKARPHIAAATPKAKATA